MEKKRFKYFRVLVNQKEDRKQKSFLEKYKDSIGTIASLCAVVAFIVTVITALIQFWNSYQAAEFYQIEQTYFFQESIIAKLFKALGDSVIRLFVVFFPMVAFTFQHPDSDDNSSKVWRKIYCFIFFLGHGILYLTYLIVTLSLVNIQLKANFLYLLFFIIIVGIIESRIIFPMKKFMAAIIIVFHIVFAVIVYNFWYENQIWKYLSGIYISFMYYYIFYLRAKYRSEKNNSIREYHETSMMIVFFILIMIPLLKFSIIGMTKNPYMDKRDYEIVQMISASNLERVEEKTESDSKNQTEQGDAEYNRRNEQNKDEFPVQVVILHRGSQVLLMNGKIDGNETLNPQEDMSSSNLVIDTRSYEFQEASQYRFYRKEFKHVTTNALQNND